MVFISHANPEDNEFSLWLALRLAAEGYPVWCDLTQLLGGEDFWTDIEEAIRHRTVKFLYVLSRVSNNRKPGPLGELEIARKVQRFNELADFIIPLGIDDLLSADYNIELTRLNVVPFQAGRHTGLARLIEKLERDGVPRRPTFNPAAVASWWRERENAQHAVLRVPETLSTNLYPLRPARLFFHRLAVALQNAPIEEPLIPYPAERFGNYLVSFAPAADLAPTLGTGVRIVRSEARVVCRPSSNQPRHRWSFRDERMVLSKLLNRAWQNMLSSRGLPTYQFSTEAPAFYFRTGMIRNDTIPFRRPDGSAGHRQMIGYRTMRRANGDQWIRHWHFALGARPTTSPVCGFIMKPHVLFSEDGIAIWESVDRLARARRSQCKQWWNNDWRDMNYAAVQFLANGNGCISLPVGTNTAVEVRAQPLEASCPVSYDEADLKRDASAGEVFEQLEVEGPESDEEER